MSVFVCHSSRNYTYGHANIAVITSGPYAGKSFNEYANLTGSWKDATARDKYKKAITTGEIGIVCQEGPTKVYTVSETY